MAGLHHNPITELPPLLEGWEGLGAAGRRGSGTPSAAERPGETTEAGGDAVDTYGQR